MKENKSVVLLNAVVPTRRVCFDSKSKERNIWGFTLIELLIVVLIIGILSAVAVPQYKKAVWKSRNATLKTILKSIRQAEDAYFMANGTYAGNFDELTLDLPLEAPVQETNSSSYSTDNTCEIATMGSDSLRRGKDFEVVLNTTNLSTGLVIAAVWTDGPYKCTGFRLISKLKCIGRYRDYAEGSRQEFCEKIEKGINKTSTPSWYYWDLP